MRKSLSLIALIAICFACPSAPGTVTPGPAGPPTPPAESPFEIRLTKSTPPGLRALLVNRSKSEQPLLHNLRSQPSRLALVAMPSKRKMSATDTRAVEKYDNTVFPGDFEKLPPGGSKLLQDQRFAKNDESGKYLVRWGPYLFGELPPGDYLAQVIFDSEIDTYREGNSNRTMPGVWKGRLRSNELLVHLE